MAFSGGPRLAISGERYVAISGGPEHKNAKSPERLASQHGLPGYVLPVLDFLHGNKKPERRSNRNEVRISREWSNRSKPLHRRNGNGKEDRVKETQEG